MTILADQLVSAVHNGDQARIESVIEQTATLLPPHPFQPLTVLVVCLAVQVDVTVPLERRTEWVAERLDPSRLGVVA